MDKQSVPTAVSAVADLLRSAWPLVLAIGGVFVLYRPPGWLKEWVRDWKKLRGKVGPVEGEVERDVAVVALAPSLTGAATAPEPPAIQDSADVEITQHEEASASQDEDWYRLMLDGKHEEGLAIARRQAANMENEQDAADSVAFALLVAFQRGRTRALDELRDHAFRHNRFPTVRLWYARGLASSNRKDEAIQEARTVLSEATAEKDIVDAARTLGILLSQVKRYDEASSIMIACWSKLTASAVRFELLVGLGRVYEAAKDERRALLYFELALREDPNDASLRFDTAYKYGQNGAPALSLHHYRRLLSTNPKNSSYLNNAGWASEQLSLNINAARYYGAASDEGSSLAMSNLASLYLGAGFVVDAKRELERAQKLDGVDKRVFTTIGEVANREAAETTSVSELLERAADLTAWRLMEAEAALSLPIDLARLSGTYVGLPAGAVVTVGPDGEVVGSFKPGLFERDATIRGRTDGRTIQFDWSNEPAAGTGGVTLFYMSSSGQGVFFIRDGQLKGYSVEGTLPTDAVAAKRWTEWSLTRAELAPGPDVGALLKSLPPVPPPTKALKP